MSLKVPLVIEPSCDPMPPRKKQKLEIDPLHGLMQEKLQKITRQIERENQADSVIQNFMDQKKMDLFWQSRPIHKEDPKQSISSRSQSKISSHTTEVDSLVEETKLSKEELNAIFSWINSCNLSSKLSILLDHLEKLVQHIQSTPDLDAEVSKIAYIFSARLKVISSLCREDKQAKCRFYLAATNFYHAVATKEKDSSDAAAHCLFFARYGIAIECGSREKAHFYFKAAQIYLMKNVSEFAEVYLSLAKDFDPTNKMIVSCYDRFFIQQILSKNSKKASTKSL